MWLHTVVIFRALTVFQPLKPPLATTFRSTLTETPHSRTQATSLEYCSLVYVSTIQ
jgi:hypothetical protein